MVLVIESGVARGVREGVLRPRNVEPRGIVVHTTGAGPWTRWQKNPSKYDSPYEAAKYVYERVSKFSGHYLIDGDSGSVLNLVHPMSVAWHVGSKGSWRYKLPRWEGKTKEAFAWWHTRFPGCSSPRDLLDGALWRRGSANELTIGIEIAPPCEGPRAEWSPKAWRTLRLLVEHLGARYGIPVDPYHIFTHSDAHPLSRTTKSGAPWDPSPRQWTLGKAAQELHFL